MMHKAIKVLYTYNGIFVLAGGLLGPLYALYVQQINSNPINISLTWTAFLISSTLTMAWVAKFGDRVEQKKHLLLAGYLIRAIVWICYIFASNIVALIILQLIFGIGEALGAPAYNALFAEHLDKGRHMEEFSKQSLIFNLIAAVAAMLGGIIVDLFSFPVLFLLMAGLAMVSFFGILFQPKRVL